MSVRLTFIPDPTALFEKQTMLIAESKQEMQNDDTLFRQIGAFLDQWVQKNFVSSGANVGGWVPFRYGGRLTNRARANAKSIVGHRWIDASAKLEMDTGALRLSFYPTYGKSIENRGSFVTIGSDLPYAQYQHFGTSILPSRRLIMREDEVVGEIMAMVEEFYLKRKVA